MFVSFRNEPKYACRAINQSPPRDGWRGGPSIGSRKYGILYKWERERDAGRNGNVKNSIIYTNWNILKSIRKCGDAWRMTRGIGSFKSHGYSHHHHHRSHRSTQLRLHCLSKRHKWSAARLSAAIGGGLSLSHSHSLRLLPSLDDDVNDKSRAARQKSVLKYLSCQFGGRARCQPSRGTVPFRSWIRF